MSIDRPPTRPIIKIADMHQDWSAIYQETLYKGGLDLSRPNPNYPLGSTHPMYGEGERSHGTKTLSSDVVSANESVQILVANLFPNPENQFAREYNLHSRFYKRILERSSDKLQPFSNAPELDEALNNPQTTAVMLSLEGIYRWNKDLSILERFWNDGIRSIMPVHNGDNALATGHKTSEQHGLTPLGREFVAEADAMGFFIDFSHASTKTALDAMDIIKNNPPLISHTGSRTLAPEETRATEDSVAIEVARRGGVIGVMPAKWLIEADENKATPESYARAFEHYMNIFAQARIPVPEKHLAIGTDYNGMGPASTTPGLEIVTQLGSSVSSEMTKRGHSAVVSSGIIRRNFLNFLVAYLPQ